MLKSIHVQGFKSLVDLNVEFPALTVLFGPNASGKSNLLEAVQLLSRCGTSRTLAEAFEGTTRGFPLEAFSFVSGGLPELLKKPRASFRIEARLECAGDKYNYQLEVQIQPGSGSLTVNDERLFKETGKGKSEGKPIIEQVDDGLHIRRKKKPAHPRQEPLHLNHALLSDRRFAGEGYEGIESCRSELEGWRVYYLDPRVAMRAARSPRDVQDIGMLGEDIAPFLYKLHSEFPKYFQTITRTLRSLIPRVESLSVDLDEKRGTLDIQIHQDGQAISSRIISEGTLRVLALCAIAANPWSRGLIAFEEPENGVHPRRLELIAELLISLAVRQKRQIIVTTHSALFCNAILKRRCDHADDIAMLNVKRTSNGTIVNSFDYSMEPLFEETEFAHALTTPTEDGLFEALMLRGLTDE